MVSTVSSLGSSFPVPSEVHLHILSFAPEVAPTLRMVSPELRKIVDEFLLVNKEEMYRGLPRATLSPVLQRCIQSVYRRYIAPPGSQPEHNALAFHYSLAHEIRALGVPAEDCPCKILGPLEMDRFDGQVQAAQDQSLRSAWISIASSIPLPRPWGIPESWNSSAQEIRAWIETHSDVLRGVTSLTLAQCYLGYAPVETVLFTGLQRLVIQLDPLTSLPEGVFHNMVALQKLHLNSNQLTSLPKGLFNGLIALEELSLSRNRLVYLPEDLFVGLVSLRRIWLYGNSLRCLPEGLFCGLPCLEIDLSLNKLSSLPEGLFAGLAGLNCLKMECNCLGILPERLFNGLTQLNYLCIRDNPLLVSNRNWADDGNEHAFVGAMDAFFKYRCVSPFAEFYQQTARGASVEAVREAFSGLPSRVQYGIYGKVWLEAGSRDLRGFLRGEHRNHAFDDMQIFYRALKRYVNERFESLREAEKSAVYTQVSRLAQEEGIDVDSAPGWGEVHAHDNLLRLIDAMESRVS